MYMATAAGTTLAWLMAEEEKRRSSARWCACVCVWFEGGGGDGGDGGGASSIKLLGWTIPSLPSSKFRLEEEKGKRKLRIPSDIVSTARS